VVQSLEKNGFAGKEIDMPANVFKRGSVFVFRRVVPETIREIIGKREIKISLGGSYRDACQKAAVLTVQTNVQFEDALSKLKSTLDEELNIERYFRTPVDKRLQPVTKLTPGFSESVAALWLAGLESDLNALRAGLEDHEYDGLNESIAQILPKINRALATGQVEIFYSVINFLLHGRGYQLALSEDDLRTLTFEFLRSAQEGYQILMDRQQGKLTEPTIKAIPLPAVWEGPVKAPSISAGLSWDGLFERW
jgi:hypothetical protein